MCGIAGAIFSSNIDARAPAERMQAATAHRGPDGAGIFNADHITLAMRRLSIIDLGGGWQPLFNEDESLVLVANGEIYNFVELRSELEAKGHRFRTHSDCETIVHLYEEYGLDAVHHLRGMFAFALWDKKRQRLLLVRDRMGEKPLYLFERNGALLFASEMKALLASGLVPFELDPASINLYFHYQYVPEPRTPIVGVRKLPPGHLLTLEMDSWRVREQCWWRMDDAPPLEGDPGERIRAELDNVARLVVRSDVPIGVALSGGLDSSAVAALAARHHPDALHAFSIGYRGRPPSDERNDAKWLADRLGLPFHDVELSVEDMAGFFPELVRWRDDPIADISGHSYYAVMKRARDHGVPVMLQGQGGDELFWGYGWVREAARRSSLNERNRGRGIAALSDFMRIRCPGGADRAALASWFRDVAGLRSGFAAFCNFLKMPHDRLVFHETSPDFATALQDVYGLYGERMQAVRGLAEANPFALFTIPAPRASVPILVTRLISQTYLLENGICQGDRLSMASGVELRLPLVDYRLVETVIGLRKTYDDSALPPKTWFKAALKDLLPPEVMNRPKRGFSPPTLDWHREIFARYGAALADGYLVESGILSAEAGRDLAAGPFPSGVNTPLSFKALVLEYWCREMNSSIPTEPAYAEVAA